MKITIFILLVVLTFSVAAGGTSEEVELISLSEIQDDEYKLKYKSIQTGDVYTIFLSHSKIEYLFKARFLTQKTYEAGISLLKYQLNEKKPVRFGWFGGGPCPVEREKNIYRSDSLNINNEGYPDKGLLVVYAFCEY